jgi:hypothetical protein
VPQLPLLTAAAKLVLSFQDADVVCIDAVAPTNPASDTSVAAIRVSRFMIGSGAGGVCDLQSSR